MINSTHRKPQSGHFFSKVRALFSIFEKEQGRPPHPIPVVVTHLPYCISYRYCPLRIRTVGRAVLFNGQNLLSNMKVICWWILSQLIGPEKLGKYVSETWFNMWILFGATILCSRLFVVLTAYPKIYCFKL